jgi:cytoskeletal protein CcmA (bactofilin family)
MARKTHDDALGVAGAETVIGTGVLVQGNLTSEADIVIDGTLDGTIKTLGNVIIGINANVKANVEGMNVTVSGTLHGDITATGDAFIRETGQVKGNIKAAGLAISSGGVFIGRSIMEMAPRLAEESQLSTTEDHDLGDEDNGV